MPGVITARDVECPLDQLPAHIAIRAAAGDGAGVVAVYMPHAVSLEVNTDVSRHRITLLDLERRQHHCSDVTVSGGRTWFQLPKAGSDLLLIAVR